jgi:hypothetical protein
MLALYQVVDKELIHAPSIWLPVHNTRKSVISTKKVRQDNHLAGLTLRWPLDDWAHQGEY